MPGMVASRAPYSPYPSGMKLNLDSLSATYDVWYVLGAKDKNSTKLVGTLVPTMPLLYAQAGEFDYGALDPQKEGTFAWTRLTGGYGHRYIHGQNDNDHYYWALGMDCSIAGAVQKGPAITVVTPGTVDATNGGTPDGFFEMTGSIGAKTLFVLNGRYCQYRVNDSTWTVSKDFGVGKVSKDVIVHTQNTGSGGTTLAYVAMGDGEHIWKFDAASVTTTWTQHATMDALCFAKNGKNLFRAQTTNLVCKCDVNADPWIAGNWGANAQFRVGDASSAIVKMRVHPDGTLFILKTDGVYVLLEDGSDVQLYAGTRFTPNGDNGLYSYLFENWIHVTYAGSHYRIAPGGAIQPIGPERAVENDSGVKGYITAGVGTPWGVVAAIYNPDTGHSFIMKYGSWEVGDDGIDHFREAWHGSLCATQFASQKIKAMFRSTVGAATDHERIYWISSTGAISYYLLNCVPNPAGCSNYVYTNTQSAGGYVALLYLSYWSGKFPIDNKAFRWSAMTFSKVETLGFGATICINEGLTPLNTGLATKANSFTQAPGPGGVNALPGVKYEHWGNIAKPVGTNAAWEIGIGPGSTTSPIMTSFGFGYQLRPRIGIVYEVLVLCEDNLLRDDGSRLGIGAHTIRSNLLAFACHAGSSAVTLPFEPTLVAQELTCIDYEETIAWDHREERWRAAIRLQMMQCQPEYTNYGAQARTLGI